MIQQQGAVSRAARERLLFGQSLVMAGIRGPVRVWRGVPSYAEDTLRTGDLVTTEEEKARLYAGRRGKVVEADVNAAFLTYHQWTGRSEVELRYIGDKPVGHVVWTTPS